MCKLNHSQPWAIFTADYGQTPDVPQFDDPTHLPKKRKAFIAGSCQAWFRGHKLLAQDGMAPGTLGTLWAAPRLSRVADKRDQRQMVKRVRETQQEGCNEC